jgi:NTE family protein
MNKRKKIGLALGSGGVRGLAHIGVLKTLLKHNIPIDFIAGSSIGAWVGAHYSLYGDVDKLIDATVGYKKEKFYSFLQPSLKGGFVRGNKVKKLLNDLLENKSFSDLNIPMTVVATDLISAKEFDISSGFLHVAVQASMAVPVVYKPLDYNGKLLVDGGLCNPVPDGVVRRMGADIVISVNLDSYLSKKFDADKLTVTKAMTRSFHIGRHYLSKYSIQDSDIVITPNIAVGGLIGWKEFFINKLDQDIIRIGEKEAEKIIPQLKKLINS